MSVKRTGWELGFGFGSLEIMKEGGKITDVEVEIGLWVWGGNIGWEQGEGFYFGVWRLPTRRK